MNAFIYHPLINVLLFITIIGEFAVPCILKRFYKEYNSKTMVMSVLGSPESPVRKIYNAWLIWLGSFLLLISYFLFIEINTISSALAILTLISVSVFAIGAGILSGAFSVNESKEKITVASKIHGMGAAIGFMSLLFFPLLRSLLAFKTNDVIQGVICALSFALAILFFVFFILGDKEHPKETVFSYEGLWERMCLFFMYVPFLYDAIINLLSI